MSNSIGCAGGSSSMMMQGMGRMQRPDPSKMADNLFSKLDTGGKGYLEKADFQSALQNLPVSDNANADDVFSSLDGDSDGKITRQEMSDGIKRLADSLDSQFQNMRMNSAMGGMGGMGKDGFTQEELASKLEGIGNIDSNRSSMISTLLDNFETTDTDDDGKVSGDEIRAYNRQRDSEPASANGDAHVMMQIMKLAQAYGFDGGGAASTGLSVTA